MCPLFITLTHGQPNAVFGGFTSISFTGCCCVRFACISFDIPLLFLLLLLLISFFLFFLSFKEHAF